MACTTGHMCTSWAFVMCEDVTQGGPHCLRHDVEAKEGGVGKLTIHLPEKWMRLKAWAGLVEEGGVGPFRRPIPSQGDSRHIFHRVF